MTDNFWPLPLTREAIEIAKEWKRKHAKHVEQLINESTSSYPPSKEDMAKPELWKPSHWRWFERSHS